MVDRTFYTPEAPAHPLSARGRLLLVTCRSGTYLGRQVYERYKTLLTQAGGEGEVLYMEDVDFQFSDSETCVRLDLHVEGSDAFLFQALFDPCRGCSVDQNYMAFLAAARALREHGARHVTAVLPYLAYARQDKPTRFMREPTTARLMADLTRASGVDRLISWHPHTRQLVGFYGDMPTDMLEALTLYIESFARFEGREDVIAVAPDAGASRFVTYFGRALNLRSALASKYRPAPEQAQVSEIIGDFRGKRTAIVLDDMISSGRTIEATVEELVEGVGIEEIYLGASHNLCRTVARERLERMHAQYHLQEAVFTDSIPQTEAFRALPFVKIKGVADTLTRVINRIHHQGSVSELFYQAEG